MWKRLHVLRDPEGDGSGGGGAAPAAQPPASAPAAAAPAAPAAGPTPAAPAASPAPAAPAASPAPKGDGEPPKGDWPDDWRERASKGDAKIRDRLGRYASPVAVAEALIAAQNRISAGELKPVLGKNPSADELKEWRSAHGIPDDPSKYDLGKDVKIDEADKPVIERILKAAHGSNQTPEQVKATVTAWNEIKRASLDAQAEGDRKVQQTSEDALRAEWGTDFRRNINLIHGLLDGSADAKLKDAFLGGRLADGTPIGSSPEALRMLLSLALIQNPTGVVVPGGDGDMGKGIKSELEELQKVPAAKKTQQQSERQRALIDAAIQQGFMDANGNWKK